MVPRSLVGVTPGTHARPTPEPEEPRPRRRLTFWRIGTPIVVLGCGALFVVSAVNSDGTDLRPGRYASLATLVGSEANSYKTLETRVATLQKEVADLTDAVPDSDVKRYQRRVDELKPEAGLTPQEGAGVSITLSDAPTELIDKTTLDPNRLVVHQQDIQAVVNALWDGGATAVTIEGQRIVSTTGIKCSGSTVQLQGVPYPEPYVIKAVGDPTALTAALDADNYVSLYRQDAANPAIGIGWQFATEADIKAPAYRGLIDLNYAKPLPVKTPPKQDDSPASGKPGSSTGSGKKSS